VETTHHRVAAVQMCAGTDKGANLACAAGLVAEAADSGVRLVVLPEVFLWRGPQAEEPRIAERIPGPVTDSLGDIARANGVYLLAGSLLEATENDRVFNTSLLFDPDGTICARYRKIHLFDVDLPSQVTIRESDTRQPGSEVVVADTSLGKVGLSICYDLRFAELYRQLTFAGARIHCVPAAFTFVTGSAHWEVLLRARAIENQAYVVAANQFGAGMGGIVNYGHSMIVDPWGTVIARASGDRAQFVSADIDFGYLEQVRAQLPALDHARMRDRGC